MVANRHFTRVDTLELKDLIYQKIGNQRAEMYFSQLNRFLGSKLNKADFDKLCIRTIGRENISLHNRLIRSIIQNACQAKIPPQKARKASYSLQSLYGDSFPRSPRKCRSPITRDRKFRDKPSPLGPLGKSSITFEETVTRTQEQSATELHSLCSKLPPVEDGEEVEQFSVGPIVRRWNSINAPLGVSLNTGSARKSLHYGETCQSSGELPDTRSLKSRLEKKLSLEGIGISMDCCNLLNKSLDMFLKRLIEPCIGIAGSRRVLGKQNDNQIFSECSGTGLERFASILDFRVAMESNLRLLGEDRAIQLEKLCHYALEE